MNIKLSEGFQWENSDKAWLWLLVLHCPGKGNKALLKGLGEQVWSGAAEGPGLVQPGEEETEGRPHFSLQIPERGEMGLVSSP